MAGDLMQVQIGQRIKKPYVDSPLTLYRALRSLNPSPYMYFYNFGDMQIVGASPEILVRNENSRRRQQEDHDPPAGRHPPARRDAGARCRTGEGTAGRPERNRRTRDADRPGAQRHRPHRRNRQRQGHRQTRDRKIFACAAHRLERRRHAQTRPVESRRAESDLPGRHPVRRAESARDGNHRRTGTDQARHLRRRLRLSVVSAAKWISRSRSAPA